MIPKEKYDICKDCPYYYVEINECMVGEDGVPCDLEQKMSNHSVTEQITNEGVIKERKETKYE